MALTPSNMLELGTIAPDFSLLDTVSDKLMTYSDIAGTKGTVVIFSCNHCPFVIHVNDELVRLGHDYEPKGVGFVAISSNDVDNYPQDGPDKMKALAEEVGYPFPYLYDETQAVAKAYDAACTPDIYLFDENRKLVYRGQLDGSRPGNDKPNDGADLRAAMDALLSGKAITDRQYPSAGCNIKWKKG